MDRTYTTLVSNQNTPLPATPTEATPSAEKLASGIGNFIAVLLTLLIAVAAVLFLLVALQPVLSILVALILFPIVLPLAVFVFVWFDVRESRMNWRKL